MNTSSTRATKSSGQAGMVWQTGGLRLFAWIRDHRRVSSESLRFVSTRIGTSLLVWLVVGIALALPAGLWLVQVNLAAMSAGWEGRPGLSVYFSPGTEQELLDDAKLTLGTLPGINTLELTTAEEALVEFRADAGLGGSLDDALTALSENPLPASIRARFDRGLDAPSLDRLIASAQGLDGVVEVVVEKTWLERLNELSNVVSRLGFMLGILFGLGAVLVTASSVRLAIESRLEELQVLKMVGASAGQIRRPFLYFGAMYGFGGGVVAAMLIALTLLVLEGPLQGLLGTYERALNLTGFDPIFLVVLLSVASVLGVLGAMLAARQRLSALEIF
ncbi:MAG: ABC transporter permease [Pseudomonadota bacterium]